MYEYSIRSLERLHTCDPLLIALFERVIKFRDCSILCGHRNKKDQNAAYKAGNSGLKWPRGRHNTKPSTAVDVIPYPFRQTDWQNMPLFYEFAGFVLGVAATMGIEIEWGGHWRTLFDGPHFQLKEIN